MFFLHRSHDEESKFPHFTALSLSTGVMEAEKSNDSSHISNMMMRPTTFSCTRDCGDRDEVEGNAMKIKRQRSLDGAGLTIGTEISSRRTRINNMVDHPRYSIGVTGYVGFGDGNGVNDVINHSKNKPFPVRGQSNVANVSDVRENGNRMSGRGKKIATCTSMPVSEKIRSRKIKNRESAARSRARKQAQEAQLQLENQSFKKENDLLKRVVRYLLTILRTKQMKSPTLSRSFSAPV